MALCSTSSRKDASQEEVQEEVHKEGRDWSSLAKPLLESILGQLTHLREFVRCGRMCRSWRSIAVPKPYSMSSQSPLLLFSHIAGPEYRSRTQTFYDIVDNHAYKIPPLLDDVMGYSHGHLILYRDPGVVVICNLFNGSEIRLPDGIGYRRTHRIVLSSTPSSPDCQAVSFSPPEQCELEEPQEIHYCCLGSEHPEWRSVSSEEFIMDIIFFKNKLYVLNDRMQLGVFTDEWKLHLLEVDQYQVKFPAAFSSHRRWILAESGGNLLKLAKCYFHFRDDGVGAMRWDFESNGGKWVKWSELEGRSLFIGKRGFEGSALLCERSRLRQNCVYYAEECASWVAYSLQGKCIDSDNSIPETYGYNQNARLLCWILPSLVP